MVRVVIGVVLTLGLSAGANAACLQSGKAGQTAEGKLVTAQFKGATGKAETVYILQLKMPLCLEGDSEHNPRDVRRLHLYSPEAGIRDLMKRQTNKDIRVTGEPFAAHTVHHRAPIVMDVKQVAAR